MDDDDDMTNEELELYLRLGNGNVLVENLVSALRDSYDKRDMLRFEMQGKEQQRVRDNQLLLDQVDELKAKLETRREWLHESNEAEVQLMQENTELREIITRAHQVLTWHVDDEPAAEERELFDRIKAITPQRKRRERRD